MIVNIRPGFIQKNFGKNNKNRREKKLKLVILSLLKFHRSTILMRSSEYPSRLLENAVNEFAALPGIGKKTALRLVMHLLRQKESEVEAFGESIIRLKKEVKYCSERCRRHKPVLGSKDNRDTGKP